MEASSTSLEWLSQLEYSTTYNMGKRMTPQACQHKNWRRLSRREGRHLHLGLYVQRLLGNKVVGQMTGHAQMIHPQIGLGYPLGLLKIVYVLASAG